MTTPFHYPDLTTLAHIALFEYDLLYLLLAWVVVHLGSHGCVWVVSYDLWSDCLVINVWLGHVYTVFHCSDLPTLAPSTLLQSYTMHVLLVLYLVYLDSQGCVWMLSCDLKSVGSVVIRGFRSCLHCLSLLRTPQTCSEHPPFITYDVYIVGSGCGLFG